MAESGKREKLSLKKEKAWIERNRVKVTFLPKMKSGKK